MSVSAARARTGVIAASNGDGTPPDLTGFNEESTKGCMQFDEFVGGMEVTMAQVAGVTPQLALRVTSEVAALPRPGVEPAPAD
jgi:hypothetical protein